jgi:DNA-binding LacI/PurR family transcriptional regulator
MVQASTLQRVRDAVERLGYVPNRAARQLAGGRTAAVAVVVPDVTNPFFAGIVQAVQRAGDPTERLVLVADTGMRPGTEIGAVESLAANVDGVIVASPVASAARLQSASRGCPLVFVNRRSRSVASVEVDQHAIVSLALGHLRELGHRDVAVLLGPRSYWSSSERSRCLDALSDARGSTVRIDADPTFDGGRQVLDAVLDSGVTAVAAFNDVMALGLVAAALERGLSVPGDLSVVGSDGVPLSEMAVPALTTVAAPVAEIGRLALRALDDQLAGETPPVRSAEPDLVVRASTAPLRARAHV